MKQQYHKFPRISHCPWSPGYSADDLRSFNLDNFVGQEVVVTLKLDGENGNICADGKYYARSIDSGNHPSRDWVKNLASKVASELPEGWRISGENMFARHSISYNNLPSYFMVFAIWNAENICLSWNATVEWCKLLGLEHVSVLYRGIWDEALIKRLWTPVYHDGNEMEGYVIRLARDIPFEEYKTPGKAVTKYVRSGHVITSDHWMSQEIVPNKLTGERK